MYEFDAMEAVDDLIDEINEEYIEAAYEAYDEIFEELCERVECGELTLEEAEIINEAAADKYLYESDDECEDDDNCKKKKKSKKKKIAAGIAAGVLAAGTAAAGRKYIKSGNKSLADYKQKDADISATKASKDLAKKFGQKDTKSIDKMLDKYTTDRDNIYKSANLYGKKKIKKISK